MLDKSTLYNVLAEGIYFFGQKPIKFQLFWTFHCLSEVGQIPVIFEISFCIPKLRTNL